jgi:hypothetical protein
MSQDMLNLLAEEGFEKHSRKDGKGVVHVEKYWT